MFGFDRTITIYNQTYDKATKKTSWKKTVIHNVSWAGSLRVVVGDGLTSNNGYSVRIPLRSMPPGFLERDEYIAKENKTEFWTAQNGDIVVPREGPDAESDNISLITKQYTENFTVTAVHTDNMTRALPHLRLEGE